MGILQGALNWLKTGGGSTPIARQIQQALPKTYSQSSPILNFLKVPQSQAQAPAPAPKQPTQTFGDIMKLPITGQPRIVPSYTPPTPSTPTGGQGQPQQQQQPQSQQPSGPSEEDIARGREEAATRAAEERMRRYGELITPLQQQVTEYMKSRQPLPELFQEQLTAQGIPEKQKLLGGYEKQQAQLLSDVETIPKGVIEARQDRGMLTAAAARRVQAMEERPIREQLLKVGQQKELDRKQKRSCEKNYIHLRMELENQLKE